MFPCKQQDGQGMRSGNQWTNTLDAPGTLETKLIFVSNGWRAKYNILPRNKRRAAMRNINWESMRTWIMPLPPAPYLFIAKLCNAHWTGLMKPLLTRWLGLARIILSTDRPRRNRLIISSFSGHRRLERSLCVLRVHSSFRVCLCQLRIKKGLSKQVTISSDFWTKWTHDDHMKTYPY